MDRLTLLVATVVAVVAVVAGFVLSPPDENRELAQLPPAVAVAVLRGDALSDVDTALTDRSGLRSVGVDFDSWVRNELIGERIFAQHVRGDDGWLYLRTTIEGACVRPSPAPVVDRVAQRLSALGRAAGIDVVVMVPPDKAAIYPEPLGPLQPAGECIRAHAADLAELGPPLVTGLESVLGLVAAPIDDAGPVYFPTDTHWRTAAGAVAAADVYARTDPQAVPGLELRRDGTGVREMDLSRMAGAEVEVEEPAWQLLPPGYAQLAREQPVAGTELFRSRGTVDDDRSVVMVRDSFGTALLPSLRGLGGQLVACNCEGYVDGRIAPFLGGADLLVVEVVQRNAVQRLRDLDAAGQLATALGPRLPSSPLPVGPDGELALPEGGVVRLLFDRVPTAVRLRTPDGGTRPVVVSHGQVSSVFAEDVGAERVTVEVDGASLVGAEQLDLGA